MASTGKTTNYELSQFIGTDKPSWLGDYNGDMLKIDTALGSINATATTAQSGVASAQSAASAAQQTANAAQQTATANKQDITELKADFKTIASNATLNNNNCDRGTVLIATNTFCSSIRVSIDLKSQPTSTVISGENTAFPLFSATGNLFNLLASTLADTNSKIACGYVTFMHETDETYDPLAILAYYDGANTVFYARIPTSTISTYTMRQIWGSFTVIPSGTILSTN